ncbi:potassium/proton antiporter [Lachnospiraceae bacterium LCP25S3_G4]
MPEIILMLAVIILICLLLNKVSSKLGMPMLLAFILLGMLFGTDGLLKVPFDNYALSEKICSFALIFIMFYGGFGTNWKSAKPIVMESVLLSTLGVILTAVTTGLFCYVILHIDFLESMLIGAVISSTDAASVFSVLRSKQLNLKNNTASMLEMESGSNDPCSYMLTVIILSVMSGQSSGGQLLYMIFAQIVYGIICGIVVAIFSNLVLSKVKFATDGFDTIFVFSMALVSYAGAAVIGGNGYLSTYIAGIILGNKSSYNKKALVHFFDGITGLMQMLIFFLLGLLSFPSQLPQILLPALAVALFLTFVSRPLSVFAILTPFKCPMNQQLLVSWAGLRGAASIVFAIVATVSPAYMKHDVFHIVFFIVLFSISIQGSLISFMAKKLHMIDNSSNVLKTFNDYSEEMPIQFIQLSIAENHPWINCKIQDISLLPELLLVLILRGKEQIVPKGDTSILVGDVVVLSALSMENDVIGCLTEVVVDKYNAWLGKSLSEITLDANKLVVVVKHNNQFLIPNGSTVVKENDILVISQL